MAKNNDLKCMTQTETAFTFRNDQDQQMIGILHHADETASAVGLLIVVGGPQYRVGAHRQYVHMARHCAKDGIPAMRFDYRGIGDSEGHYPGFENAAPDIHHAIDAFLKHSPQIETVALWGLCEGASAILLGGARHKAVSHIILANPWVRSDSGLAKAYVKHYYWERLKSPELWRKIFSGGFKLNAALSGLWDNLKKAFTSAPAPAPAQSIPSDQAPEDSRPFPERMQMGLAEFSGQSLLIQSENDLTAREFDDMIRSDKRWKQTLSSRLGHRVDLSDTDHTFSTEEWRLAVAKATSAWLRKTN